MPVTNENSKQVFCMGERSVAFRRFKDVRSRGIVPLSFLLFYLCQAGFILRRSVSNIVVGVPTISFQPCFSFLGALISKNSRYNYTIYISVTTRTRSGFVNGCPCFIYERSIAIRIRNYSSVFPVHYSTCRVNLVT